MDQALQLKVFLIGRVALEANGELLDERRLPGRQGRLLFAYLAAAAGRPVPRDELAEAIWGEAPPPTWEKGLTVIVSKLRSVLAADGIVLTNAFGCYRLELPGGSWVDVAAASSAARDAEEALAAGDGKEAKAAAACAVALLSQPFLPGEEAAWVERERRELADVQGRALNVLAEVCLLSGDAAEAAEWAEQTISLTPYRETGYRRLMEAHVAAGNPAEALRVYERCRRLLADELGTYPSRETESIYRSLLEVPARPPPTAELQGTRIGRRLAVILGTGLVAVAACLAAGALATRDYGLTGGPPDPPSLGEVAFFRDSAGQHISYTGVGTTPGNIVFGEGAVWVLNTDDRTITRIDPATGRVVKTFAVGGEPTDLAVGSNAIWVASGGAGKGLVESRAASAVVSRVDPVSTEVTRTFRLRGPAGFQLESSQTLGLGGLAIGRGSVWAVDSDGSISRIINGTGPLARIAVTGARAIAVGDAGVWFLTTVANGPAVGRIDPGTNKVAQVIPVPTSSLVGIAVGAGYVWATDPYDGVVWRIAPGPKPVERTVALGLGVTQIAFGDNEVWVANLANGTVSRIDPRTDDVTATRALDGTPQGVAVHDGSVWVSVADGTTRGALPAASCGPVESGGEKPDVILASDLPLQGPTLAPTLAAAIRFVLRSHRFRAGRFVVGYQSCDDSTARTQGSDFFKCASNARAFSSDERLVAVVGPYDSSCAQIEIPVTNRSPSGPLAIISPANTVPSLTRVEREVAAGQPGILYPTGVRSFFRLASPDDLEGAGIAVFAKKLGLDRVYVLTDGSAYGDDLSRGFESAAGHLGVTVPGTATWSPSAGGSRRILAHLGRAKVEGVLLAGYSDEAGNLVRALRRRFGSRLTMLAGDGFLGIPDTLKAAGPAAEGMYVNTSAVVDQSLTPAGRSLLRAFEASRPERHVPSGTYLPETLEAAEVVIDAIARSDGTRASVLQMLSTSRVSSGVFGRFHFDHNGDMSPAPFAIVRITGGRGDPNLDPDLRGAVFERTVRAPISLLDKVRCRR